MCIAADGHRTKVPWTRCPQHNCKPCELTAGCSSHHDPQTQLIHSRYAKSDGGTQLVNLTFNTREFLITVYLSKPFGQYRRKNLCKWRVHIACNCNSDWFVVLLAYICAASFSRILSRRHQWATCSYFWYCVDRRSRYAAVTLTTSCTTSTYLLLTKCVIFS